MRRFIITGAPGAGKTAIIRQLELDGFSVVEEAATDIIAAAHAQGTVEPWRCPSFIDAIANLQRDRQIRASYQPDEVQFHDRCVVCTAALSVFLGHPFSPSLAGELERIKKEAIYQNRVFFIRNLGFITRLMMLQHSEPVRFYSLRFRNGSRDLRVPFRKLALLRMHMLSCGNRRLACGAHLVVGFFKEH